MTPKGMYCRTCVCVLQHDSSRCPPVYNIFDNLNFAKKLKHCSTIHIEPNDQYPHSVCRTCYEKVLDFYEFQLMCRDSIRIFNEMYDCDNDLEEALCDKNHLSNAKYGKERNYQNDNDHIDDQILQTDFQEEHVVNGILQDDYENGDFIQNVLCKYLEKNAQVDVVKVGQQSFNAVENNPEESRELDYEEFVENKICKQHDISYELEGTQKDSLNFPYTGNNILINKFNGNIEKLQLYTLEESANNYKKIETVKSTTINKIDQAEKDHIETIAMSEIVMDITDMDLHEIDVYTTSKNCDNVDEDKIENLVNDQNQQEKPTKVNERNNVHIGKDNAISKRQSKIQRNETHKDEDGTTCDLSETEKIAAGRHIIIQGQLETKSKPNKKRSFFCNVCSKYFRFHHSLEAHKRQHAGLQGYPCSHKNCDSTFDRFVDLQDHLNDHDGIPRTIFKCENDNCEREFFKKSGLTLHMKLVHKCLPAKQTHDCVTCGKIFKDSQKLREHSFIHKDKSTWLYTCDVEGCMRKCRTWIHMRIHKNRHAGIKKFTCPHCGIAKTTSQELRSHVNFHTSERTWSCEHCTKVCKSLANLQRHTKNKHSGSTREFKCSFCNATFATIEVKKSHEKRHTSDKPHVCEECGMRFIWAYKLRAHHKMHKEKTNQKTSEK